MSTDITNLRSILPPPLATLCRALSFAVAHLYAKFTLLAGFSVDDDRVAYAARFSIPFQLNLVHCTV